MHTYIKYMYFTCVKHKWNASCYLQHIQNILTALHLCFVRLHFYSKVIKLIFHPHRILHRLPQKVGKKSLKFLQLCFVFCFFLNRKLKYNTHISIYILCWAVYGNTFGSNYIVKSFWVWCTLICGHFYECNMTSEVLRILSGCTVKTELKNALFKNILLEPIVFPIVILLVMTWENSVHVHWSK